MPRRQFAGRIPLARNYPSEVVLIQNTESRVRLADLSTAQLRYLESLEEFPPGLEWSHYAPVHVSDEFTPFPVQSWPIFLGEARRQRFERAATAVSRLIRSVPKRFLGADPKRLQEVYGITREQSILISTLIRTTGILDGAFSRCDFLDTADGLSCVEMNAGNISGWQTARYLERFGRIPAIRRFAATEGEGTIAYRNPVRNLFAHFLEQGRPLAKDGELNLCFAVDSAALLGEWVPYLSSEYQWALKHHGGGLEGALVACPVSSLEAGGGVLRAGDHRIHVVHEPSFGRLTKPLLAALLARKVLLFNGPTSRVLADKINLALLSEAVGGEKLSAEESAAVDAWIPWTRRVRRGKAVVDGEEVRLPEWLLEERERLVLKACFSLGGKEVHVGRFTSPEQWQALVQQALEGERWIVQEFLESPPYTFLGRSGPALHDLVWGLFVFGERYGGNFFRVQECTDQSRGVVNATQGASFGLVLEVEWSASTDSGRQAFNGSRETDASEVGEPKAMEFEARAEHVNRRSGAFLSELHQNLAERMESLEDAERVEAYERLRVHNTSTLTPAQPWPLFLPEDRAATFGAVASGLMRLLLDLPQRLLANDPTRYAEFYRIGEEEAQLIAGLIERPGALDHIAARGDFLETAEGLRCLEINVGGGLGGWSVGVWAETYLSDPLIRTFLQDQGVEPSHRIPARAMLQRLVDRTLASRGVEEVHVAFAAPSKDLLQGTGRWAEDYETEYGAVLQRSGIQGSATTCSIDELREEGGQLFLGDRRIHAVVEACDGNLPHPVLTAFLAGTVDVLNGPVNRVLSDKLNLALLSERVDSEQLTPEEKSLVKAHVPWTRRLSAEFVDRRGERFFLPDLLLEERECMVVKPSYSGHGDDVHLGPATSPERWQEIVQGAVEEGGWVAQELLEGIPRTFPAKVGEGWDLRPHDVVWGLLTAGTDFTGCFVRLMERQGHRVINSARGACVGAVLEVEEEPPAS